VRILGLGKAGLRTPVDELMKPWLEAAQRLSRMLSG